MKHLAKDVLLGLAVTTVVYFVPLLNTGAGVVGGFVSAYVHDQGPIEGIKVGLLKGLLFFIPAIVLAVLFAEFLGGLPVVGGFLEVGVVVLAVVLTAYTTVKAVIGGFVGGYLAQRLRSELEPP